MLAVELPKRSYVAAACRRAGVPSLWLDDAIQDVLLHCWLRGRPWINWAVIDAARRYGPHDRRGNPRAGPLGGYDAPAPDAYAEAVDRLDWPDTLARWQRAVARLSAQQQRNLFAPEDHVNATQVKRARARRRLREVLAA